jgi:single-stranded-DNA-specific exonuclease
LRYKLIKNSANDTNDIIGTVLRNRGVENPQEYLNCTKTSGSEDWRLLDNIDRAVEVFDGHFQNKDKIVILADNDTDGLTSATVAHQYIKDLDRDYPVTIVVHDEQKSHGLCGDFELPEDTKLLWVPDAASNDYQQCMELIEKGIDIIITDHHECSEDGYKNIENGAVVINNQASENYPNKSYCGCAITREFCRALDEFYWTDYASKYDDLVAIANIADVMSLKDVATRREVALGLANIRNKMLSEIFDAQSFSTKGVISPFTVSFYISPLINSYIRMGTADDKRLLLRAFCEDESETFEYTKRGETKSTQENIYQHCVRIMKSYKGKQDRQKEKGFKELQTKISKSSSQDKVIVCDCTEELEQALTGLVAIKVAESFNKPILLLRRKKDDPKVFGGSGRAFDYCPIEDFRGFTESCPYVTLAQGHNQAFGVEIPESNISKAQEWFNKQLADMDFSKVYVVDFEVDADEVDFFLCRNVDEYKTLWAKEVEKPLFAIKGLVVDNKCARICGKNSDTIQITWEDFPVKYVQFKVDENNELYDWLNNNWDENATVELNIIGTLELSTYNGITTGQVNIEDLEIAR